MRRTAIVAVLVLTLGIAASAALADGEHFNKKDTFGTLSGGTLTVNFKVSGLGTATPQVYVFLTGFAQCVNNGDHNPKADNKSGFTTGSTFDVVNGSSSGTLTASSDAHCGTGQTLEFLNVTINEADSAASAVDASLSLGNFP